MSALRVGEVVAGDDAPRLVGIPVLDRGFEVLAHRVGLLELPTQPAQQAHLGGAAYRLRAQICSLRSVLNPSRS